MSGVRAGSLLQSIERSRSFTFQQKTCATTKRYTGDLGVLHEEEDEVEGAEPYSRSGRHKTSFLGWSESGDGLDEEEELEGGGEPVRQRRTSKIAPAPIAEDDEGVGDEDGEEEAAAAEEGGSGRKKKSNGAVGIPEATTAAGADKSSSNMSKRWRKVRIAAKTMSSIKAINQDVRLYGAKATEDDEDQGDPRFHVHEEPINKAWFILLPHYRIRRSWELLIVILLLYVVAVVPVRVCFDLEPEGAAASFDFMVDMFFILDVFFNMICSYQNSKGELVVKPSTILVHYARTWMLLDVVASVPLYQFIGVEDGDNAQINRLGKIARLPRLFRLIKLLRLLKLLRVVKLVRYFNQWEQYNVGTNVAVTRMIKVTCGIFFVTHLIGCFWYLVAWIGYDSVHPSSWVASHGIADADAATKYVASLYWAFSTLTTVGFGDISAKSNQERVFSIICMMVGVSWYAFVISTISSIINMFDRRNAEVKKKQRLIQQFMSETKMPWPLRRRILKYFDYVNGNSDSDVKEMENVLAMLSTQLRTEVTLHVHRNVVPLIPFFLHKTPQFIAACVALLRPLYFAPGDYISTRGQHADEMYFLVGGRAVVVLPNGVKFKSIVEGSYFGEIGCMLAEVHRVSIVAVNECRVYALAKLDLKALMAEYPDVASEVRQTARKRIEHLNNGRRGSKDANSVAANFLTSFPGMAFDEASGAPAPPDDERSLLLAHNAADMDAGADAGAGGGAEFGDDSDGVVPALAAGQVMRMEASIADLREDNKALRISMDEMRGMLAEALRAIPK